MSATERVDGPGALRSVVDRPPIGHGSLLWRVAGDVRAAAPGGATGLLQLMYPPLGTAVAEQSGFFADPFGRIWRSVPQIWATIFEPDGPDRGRRIRDLHRDIKGTDSTGRRYHALDPETFWWAHATFTWHMFRTVELFFPVDMLGAEGRERLYAETVSWYERYAVTMRPVPTDYAAFQEVFAGYCAERLMLTEPARRCIEIARTDGIGAVPFVPDMAIRLGRPVLRRVGTLIAIGCLPEPVRQRLEIVWSESEQCQFNRLATALRHTGSLIPAAINRRALLTAMRLIGDKTRNDRYRPDPGARDC